ncbi:MAG TPA: glycosyltransferase family 39 protein [Solirubrobacteraceae bacterium]|nr:glycosyltransferase family 39 protein [Solirubrobacteraceae bacterium]
MSTSEAAVGPATPEAATRSSGWWRTAVGEPAWARPTLLALTVIAGLGYAWNATGNLEIYYAAAVRSMSISWHDFFFGAFDPAGTITVDKLPGAFWVQALSVRLFGVHAWAIVAPQVLEGMASVLVLYRLVRRLAGPRAAILAAGVFVLSPATIALNRGNIPDTLMILLVLLAADATVRAALSGRLRSLVWAGVLVGLAFQAKMIEAWLVLPALALAYLVADAGAWRRRIGRLGIAGLVTAAVSLSWMIVVSLWPAGSRPYVDGSSTNSIFSQVFVYNGFGRVDQASPNQLLTRAIGLRFGSPAPGWDRLLTGGVGHDTAWLIPAALIALAGLLIAGRGRDRLLRTSAALWGTWLIVLLIVFSASSTINPYYTAALSPPIAALLGTAAALAWERRAEPQVRLAVAATVLLSAVYAVWLLPDRGVGLVTGLPEAVIALALGAIVFLVLAPRTWRTGAIALSAVAIIAVPAAASASVVSNGFGPFDTPFESAADSAYARTLGQVGARTETLLPALERAEAIQPDLMATQTSAVAAPFIYDSGQEVVPIGGFTGTIPEPSLARLQAMIAQGDFHLVIQAPTVSDPRLVWVADHCFPVKPAGGGSGGLRFAVYFCGRLGL